MSKGKKFGAMSKQLKQAISTENFFKTEINAQMASAAPPLGPLLGKFGLNINNFCKTFNEKTKTYKTGIPLPVTVKIKPDRSYDILLETPSISYFLMQASGISFPKLPEETKSGEISLKHIYEIAKIKHEDPFSRCQVIEMDELVEKIIAEADTMGLELVKEIDPVQYKDFLTKRNLYLDELLKQLEEQEKLKFQRMDST